MKLIHVAAAVLNQTPLDWQHNPTNIRRVITDAREQGIGVLCLPELCLTGYGCEDAFHSVNTHERAWKALIELLPETRGMLVSFGLPVLHQNGLFNCAALAVDGKLIGLVAKRFLAGDGIHYEPRWFKAWPAGVRDDFTLSDGTTIPIGDIHFDVGNVQIGFEICEDAWVANRPGATLALHGIDLILNPSASHFAFGKLEVRKRFVLEGSRAFGVSYVYSNLLGNEAGRAIYDGGALIASGGKLIAAGPRFSFEDFKLTSAVIDVDATRMSQARTASFNPDLAGDNKLRISAPFNWPPVKLDQKEKSIAVSKWETSADLKEEEFLRAEALALFDYLRKSHSQGFVVSLSGGADSAAVTCLVSLSLEMALAELGADALNTKLSHTSGGLSPIAGIDKAFLRQWLRWLETKGPEGLHAIPALAAVNQQAPTAELRPADRHQTDEDDLMPYDILDAIERAAIRDKNSPLEVFELMRGQFINFSPQQIGIWVDRFFKLWCRNQWKRERYAPSFHLDDENLDPKTWCRFPILSGGFETELAELRSLLFKLT